MGYSGVIKSKVLRLDDTFDSIPYIHRFNVYLNASNSADSMYRLASRWFMWRMDSLGLITITLTAIVTVATKVRTKAQVIICREGKNDIGR